MAVDLAPRGGDGVAAGRRRRRPRLLRARGGAGGVGDPEEARPHGEAVGEGGS